VILDAARPERVELFLPRPPACAARSCGLTTTPQRPVGDLEWIDTEASAMGELLFTLFGRMGLTVDVPVGMGLYATLIADTGGFRYESTTAAALNLAARLVDLGVKPWDVAEQVYERQPLERVRLLSRVLSTLRVAPSGRLACVSLLQRDLQETGTTPPCLTE